MPRALAGSLCYGSNVWRDVAQLLRMLQRNDTKTIIYEMQE